MLLKHTYGLSLLFMALGAAVVPANAQQMYRGTVNLPSETRWGGAVLQPGLHMILVEAGFNGIPLIHVFQQGMEMTILAWLSEAEPISGTGSLKLVNVGGTMAVKHFDAGVIGKSFDFIVPKVRPSKAERAVVQSETSVPVTSTF